MSDYDLSKVTTEIWTARCKICGRPFSSDVKSKAVNKAKDHIRDKHGK